MKDLLIRKPSLAELTGISNDRLNSFATQLRAYLGVSTVTNAQKSGVLYFSRPSDDDSLDSSKLHFSQSSFICKERSQFQQHTSQGSTTNLNHLGSLCSKSSSSGMGLLKSLSSEQITARAKLMQVGDDNALPNSMSLASTNCTDLSSSMGFGEGKLPEANLGISLAVLNVVDAFGKPLELPLSGQKVQVPSSSSSHFSPHYCWCPPVSSTLHYTLSNSQMPSLSTESLHLPSLSSLLSAAGSSKSSLNLSEVPSVDFPSFQPEPLISLPTSQIPTFTPLICDPIVHIPMVDVCSAGPGYLVSGGLAMATTIPPLSPNLVDPLISNSESVVEKSARETLRMLINSQPNSQVLPAPVFSSCSDKPNVLTIGGSRGVYCGTRDIQGVSGGLTNMGLVFVSEKSLGGGVGKIGRSRDDSVERLDDTDSSGME